MIFANAPNAAGLEQDAIQENADLQVLSAIHLLSKDQQQAITFGIMLRILVSFEP